MPSLKAIRKRISSVKSTQQITKAMKMVSAAKLRRAQEAAVASRPYAEKLTELLRNVALRCEEKPHPLLLGREEERTVDLVLVTADRGLCGGYNAALCRRAEAFLAQRSGATVRLTLVGRKGYEYFRKRRGTVRAHHINLAAGPDYDLAVRIAEELAAEYAAGTTDGLYVLYSEFRSPLSQVPTVERLLPVETPAAEETGPAVDYIYEPAPEELLDRLLDRYVVLRLHRAFLESIASEHGARMTAMDSATRNAGEMIERLTLQMNRARQSAITTELMEIVSGAEALKG